ncbi:MAG: YjzC family protein [Gammaproteobacteria bacterium]|nr:YjzC family protein [Gammaproteobacteria bacterium]
MTGKKPTPAVKPGQKVQDSGIYRDGSGKRATMVKGEPAPPTSKKGQKWKQVVDTNPDN